MGCVSGCWNKPHLGLRQRRATLGTGRLEPCKIFCRTLFLVFIQSHTHAGTRCRCFRFHGKPSQAFDGISAGLQGGEKQGKVTKLSKNEVLMLNIGSMCTGARVIAVRPHPPP